MAIVRPNIRLQRITVQRDDLAKREKVGGVLGATGSLPESIIPKGYFLVFVPSDSAYLSTPTRPRDRVSERERERAREERHQSVCSPFATGKERKKTRQGGGRIVFTDIRSTLFFSTARGEIMAGRVEKTRHESPR